MTVLTGRPGILVLLFPVRRHVFKVSGKLEIQAGMTGGDEIVIDVAHGETLIGVLADVAGHANRGAAGQVLRVPQAPLIFLFATAFCFPSAGRVRCEIAVGRAVARLAADSVRVEPGGRLHLRGRPGRRVAREASHIFRRFREAAAGASEIALDAVRSAVEEDLIRRGSACRTTSRSCARFASRSRSSGRTT